MIPSLGLQIAAASRLEAPLNEEQLAQRDGLLVRLPSLRDRLALHLGEFFIRAGRKLTSASLEHMQLTEEVA